MTFHRWCSAFLIAAWVTCAAAEESPEIHIERTRGAIRIDGDLSDPGWEGAATVDTFYEVSPGDNVAPPVRTTARLAYDDEFLYIAFDCEDPDVTKLRAPFRDRDSIFRIDFVQVYLDSRNERKAAIDFRVTPRGIQSDGIFTDAVLDEDFSPDFAWDAASRIGPKGWTAELRIPFSSLRYSGSAPTFAIGLGRTYPRDFLRDMQSYKVPRGSNCVVCRLQTLTGLKGLPSRLHVLVVPYATAAESGRRRDPADSTSSFVNEPVGLNAGVDAKIGLRSDVTLDTTVNPDFSQVESDETQLSVNNRFALFYPEKRPFFMEGVDLFATPIQAVYTRTITSPRWGLRATGRLGSSSFGLLVAEDRAGGSAVLPGPVASGLAPREDRSLVFLGRLRQDLGRSFAGLLLTGRQLEGGGHNWVFGPDLQWRLAEADVVTGQFLISDTRTPVRPDLTPQWDGRRFASRGLDLAWDHSTRTFAWHLSYRDMGDGFRADDGFVPQVGFRQGTARLGYNLFPEGLVTKMQPYVLATYAAESDGALLSRSVTPGIAVEGLWASTGYLEVHPKEKIRVGDTLLETTFARFFFEIYPPGILYGVALDARVGQDFDYVNARVGRGGQLTPIVNFRPSDRLELRANGDFQWLDVTDAEGRSGRLFTAESVRLKVTYYFKAGVSLRLIGELLHVTRTPSLYVVPVSEREGSFVGTALFTYRVNWQTVLFLGYGDTRILSDRNDLVATDRQLFLKLSYAFRR